MKLVIGLAVFVGALTGRHVVMVQWPRAVCGSADITHVYLNPSCLSAPGRPVLVRHRSSLDVYMTR